MLLNIEIPEHLEKEEFLKIKNIPCHCKLEKGIFQLSIDCHPFKAIGTISDYSIKEINNRSAAYGGGAILYDHPAMVSLQELSNNLYKISYLSFFQSIKGWQNIVQNFEYSPIETDSFEEY